MGFSINRFTYVGVDEFDLSFSLGYATQTDVTCYKDGVTPVQVSFDWVTPSRVRIVPTDVAVGDTIVFTRTVSKQTLPVDLTQPENLTRQSINTALLHTVYMLHEVLDGRIDSLPIPETPADYIAIFEYARTA